MMSLIEWIHCDKKRKAKELANEPRSNQTHGESGNDYQQGEVARGDSQIAQQTVHVFPVPELYGGYCGGGVIKIDGFLP